MTTSEDAIFADGVPLAAELALGVLDGDERAEALRRVLADPVFAREVETWRAHFALLFAEWPEESVDTRFEERMFAALGDAGASRGAGPRALPPRRNGWAWAAGAATLVAASLVLALALRPERIVTVTTPAPIEAAPLVAVIAPKGGGKPFAAVYDAKRGEVRLAGAVAVPHGRTAELWSIGGDSTPHALGVFDGREGSHVAIGGRNTARLVEGATLAVSIEPTGGSPTGSPTGPVVATGVLARS